jgi:glycosyltransferase involved in cell wall biosynthesis
MESARHRLAYVVHSLNPGGAEKLVVESCLAFAREFELEVFCLDTPGRWVMKLRSEGIPVHCLWRQPGFDVSMAMSLARQFRRMKAEVVHAHQCTPWFYAALSRLVFPRPRLVFQEHGRHYPERDSRAKRWINRLIIQRLTHELVAVSSDVRARLARFEGVDAERVHVVHNGVNAVPRLSREAREALRRSLGLTAHEFVIGTAGRFDAIKNLPMLVESIAKVAGPLPSARGLLVGDGPELGRIKRVATELGIINRVVFTGFRDDAPELIQCMDLFVLSSLSEGVSLALLEAMSSAVPVVVTAVGGNVEVVAAGICGWTVASGAVDELASALLEAAREPSKRARFAASAEARFRDEFSFDAMIARYRRIYEELIDSRIPVHANE